MRDTLPKQYWYREFVAYSAVGDNKLQVYDEEDIMSEYMKESDGHTIAKNVIHIDSTYEMMKVAVALRYIYSEVNEQ